MVNIRRLGESVLLAKSRSAADGSITAKTSLPVHVRAGGYLVFAEGPDPAGAPRIVVAPLAVTRGTGPTSPVPPPVTGGVPAVIAAVRPSFPASDDLAIVEDVANGTRAFILNGSVLDVVERSSNGAIDDGDRSSDAPPWWAWAAALAGVMLFGTAVLLRRRRA